GSGRLLWPRGASLRRCNRRPVPVERRRLSRRPGLRLLGPQRRLPSLGTAPTRRLEALIKPPTPAPTTDGHLHPLSLESISRSHGILYRDGEWGGSSLQLLVEL